METNPIVHKSYFLQGLAGAILINFLLFCSLPGLIHMDREKNDIESLNFIQFTRIKRPPPPPKSKKKVIKEEAVKKVKPVKVVRPTNRIPQKQLSLNMPLPDLNMDSRICGGIPMVPPPQVMPPSLDLSGILDENQVDTIPAPTYKRAPQYPYRARRMGLEGEVKIQFIVDPTGQVSDIVILEADPPDIFDQAVHDAVSSWRYSPGELAGQRVTCRVTTSVIFKMEAN